ncbi:MAG TPA: branched-chain amino acid aminotransferase [Pyrinomonadaceae bacterium]
MLTEVTNISSTLPDWDTLEFKLTQTENMFIARTDAALNWVDEGIYPFGALQLSPAATALNYGQAVFEGMKALRNPDGKVLLFRPEENAKRFRRSAARLEMPPYPVENFIRWVQALVQAEEKWVPPFGKGSLYIRPVMIGEGATLGVAPSPNYTFYIFVSPVGLYRPGEGRLMVQDSTHRAALFSTGDLKAAGNYAGTLRSQKVAASLGYKDVLYLDARHDRYIEEVGSSNFFAVLKDGTLVTPRLLGSILPGITRDSIITIARELLGWKVIEKGVEIDEVLSNASEAFFTGTAAGVQPITTINYKGIDYRIGEGSTEASTKLRDVLVRLQTRQIPDPFGWVIEV